MRALLLGLALLQGCAALPSQESDKAALLARGDAWDKAIVHKDRAAILANMRADFQQIREGGGVAGRDEFLEAVLSPRLTIDPYTVEEWSARVYGDTALVSGTTRMTGSWDGKPFKTRYRYIDVYVRTGGQWQVASVQITPMAQD
jgi:ketosteroid isomerase-like protein